jgi:hypothetical protein
MSDLENFYVPYFKLYTSLFTLYALEESVLV